MKINQIEPGKTYRHALTHDRVIALYVKSWTSGTKWVCRRMNYELITLHYSELKEAE